MGRALWTAALGVACVFVMSVGWCARTWDAGYNIGGMLDDKEIVIAASCEDGPSTDTMGWMGMDMDHYVDQEESVPVGEGDDGDALGGFGEVKCWWTCADGSVTNGAFQTTWTAPYEVGVESNLEIGVIDLPKAIAQGEAGNRDDPGREYFGTSGGAVEVTITATPMPGPVRGPLRFTRFASPHDAQVGCTTPDTPLAQGFYMGGFLKRTELRGEINVNTLPGSLYEWYQDKKGEETYDGDHRPGSPWPDWTPDGPQPWSPEYCTQYPVASKIWLIDTPGAVTGWSAPLPDEPHTYAIDVYFRTRVKFKGRWCSKEWTYWHRELRLYSNEATGYKWAINANQ